MDDLIAFYERELGQLRGSLAEFAERFPKAAARLSISGQRSEDHHVERMIESAALLNARVTARLEDLSLIHISEPTRRQLASRMPSSA